MFAKVIPILRLPANLSVFDYLVPKELAGKIKLGGLAKISFRRKITNGLVIGLVKKSTINPQKLKSIISLVLEEPILGVNQLKLLNWLSDYYYISPALAAKLFIPQISIKQKIEKSAAGQKEISGQNNKIKISDVDQVVKGKAGHLCWFSGLDKKIDFYLDFITKATEGQILFLFPDADSLDYVSQKIKEKTDFEVVTSGLSAQQLWQAWNKIKSGQSRVILGTRLALFYPFGNLKYVLLDEENNLSYKQWDQNPRYDGKLIAEKVCQINLAKLILVSVLPSLETYKKAIDKKLKLLKQNENWAKIKVIDLAEKIKGGEFSLISQELLEKIKENLQDNQKIALVLNRKGFARITHCRDCGHIARCPDCGNVLTLSGDLLVCLNCKFKQDNLLFCPSCQSPEIKSMGWGTQKVESEIKKYLPEKNIYRLDSDANSKYYQKIKASYEEDKIAILIGTQMIIKPWLSKKLGLLAFINLDTDLNLPNYRATENVAQLIAGSLSLLKNEGELIIQTYNQRKDFFENIKEYNWPNFYKKELADRQALSYPPFGTLLKLIYQTKNKNKILKNVQELEQRLKNKYPDEKIFISKLKRIRKYYQQSLIIKSGKIDFRPERRDIPTGWLIDLTPTELD